MNVIASITFFEEFQSVKEFQKQLFLVPERRQPEWRHWRYSGVFVVDFKPFSPPYIFEFE